MSEKNHPDAWAAILQGAHWAWVILLGLSAWLSKTLYDVAITRKFQSFDERLKTVDAKQDAQLQTIASIKEDLAYLRAKAEDRSA